MDVIGDGLERAVRQAFTCPIPKSAGAQMRYLVKRFKDTRAVADVLSVSQRRGGRAGRYMGRHTIPAAPLRLPRTPHAFDHAIDY